MDWQNSQTDVCVFICRKLYVLFWLKIMKLCLLSQRTFRENILSSKCKIFCTRNMFTKKRTFVIYLDSKQSFLTLTSLDTQIKSFVTFKSGQSYLSSSICCLFPQGLIQVWDIAWVAAELSYHRSCQTDVRYILLLQQLQQNSNSSIRFNSMSPAFHWNTNRFPN